MLLYSGATDPSRPYGVFFCDYKLYQTNDRTFLESFFFSNKNNFSICEELPLRPLEAAFVLSEPTENKKGFNAGMGDWIWIASKTWGFPFLGLRPLGELMWVACGFAKVWGRFFDEWRSETPKKLVGLVSGWLDSGILFWSLFKSAKSKNFGQYHHVITVDNFFWFESRKSQSSPDLLLNASLHHACFFTSFMVHDS